jgi:hypothetical protein
MLIYLGDIRFQYDRNWTRNGYKNKLQILFTPNQKQFYQCRTNIIHLVYVQSIK